MIKRAFLFILLFALAAGGGYYWYTRHYAPAAATAQAPAPAPPPPEVGIVIAQPAEIPFPVEYAGRVAGFRDVEVRPLVSGLLLKREFEEGARVKQGQVLFRIDPATYQVALSRAEAQLHQAQATLRQTEENFKRIEELSRRQVATERQLDEAIAAREQARASVQLAEAEISAAKLNLGYTVVNAPASGVTALQSPPEGTLIQAQQTLLTRTRKGRRSGRSMKNAPSRSRRRILRSSCTMRTVWSIRKAAGSTSPRKGSTSRRAPSRRAPFSPTRTAPSFRASSSG